MKNLLEKIKPYQDGLFLILVITLVALVGFGLGRLSAPYQTAGLEIQSTLVNTADLEQAVVNQKIVGNKNSKIYHYKNCPGALRMSEGNKVFFASVIDARNAGFRPAGNCPGLE